MNDFSSQLLKQNLFSRKIRIIPAIEQTSIHNIVSEKACFYVHVVTVHLFFFWYPQIQGASTYFLPTILESCGFFMYYMIILFEYV